MTNNVLLIIISATLIAAIAPVSSHSLQTNEIDGVCLTPGCLHAAYSTIKRMDRSVNPCDDFYNFACGSFQKFTQIPDGKSKVDAFSAINDKVRDQLRSCIGEKVDPNDPAAFKAVKKIYGICMDESVTEQRGKQPLLNILDALGGWPVIEGDQWNTNGNWTWAAAIGEFRKIGFATNYITSTVVSTDLKNSTSRKLHVS